MLITVIRKCVCVCVYFWFNNFFLLILRGFVMKSLLILLAFVSFNYVSLAECQLPEGWVALKYGGQTVSSPDGDYEGFSIVTIGEVSKAVHCEGAGGLKCCLSQNLCNANLNNALIGYAITKINIDNVLSGTHSINMIVDGFLRYGGVTWSTNISTGGSTITTTIN